MVSSSVRAELGAASNLSSRSARLRSVGKLSSRLEGETIVTIAWGLSTIIFAVAAVGLASPACADEPFNGIYSLDNSGEPGTLTMWIAHSTCDPTGCIAHIFSSTGWRGDAQLVDGRWTTTVDRPDGTYCLDGQLSVRYRRGRGIPKLTRRSKRDQNDEGADSRGSAVSILDSWARSARPRAAAGSGYGCLPGAAGRGCRVGDAGHLGP